MTEIVFDLTMEDLTMIRDALTKFINSEERTVQNLFNDSELNIIVHKLDEYVEDRFDPYAEDE